MTRLLSTFLTFMLLTLVIPTVSFAEGDAMWFETMEDTSAVAEKTGKSFTDRIVLAPVPMINPTLGGGIIGVGMYMHPEDDFGNDSQGENNATRHSISGVAGMLSTNRSWAVGGFHKGFYANDKFRGTALLGYGEFNLKFYGIGDDSILRDRPIKYTANITAFQPTFLAKISDNWFIGPRYKLFNWHLGFNLSELHNKLPDLKQSFTTGGFGLAGEWDTTDHSVYATKGGKFEFSLMDYRDVWGGDLTYAKSEMNYNHYWSPTDRLVLAGRADLNLSTGSTPFFDMPFLHLRGFPYAQYIDKQSASIQAEARYEISKKWAANLFGGLGWIGESPKELYKRPVIPTGGAGIRYLISEEQRMYMGMEAAFGPDSKALYFRIGEYF
ncbi:hypothetical protein [Pseudodesulfovibrio sp. zrk46]|uniref:hypothetical protein n=1 Tax=Pseudodesulfovibrio sp. zrk46 TaxID=2725288 RepID=UPI0014496884|nr:hypothetical protein [Pseudodesulfovibrio sp. zrk46]QJB54990.1 hypothetical protein HFN16_00610 [Pseudodesulfovibrio sp. zrk46]